MKFRLLFMPPQNERTRAIAKHVANEVAEATVLIAESMPDAAREIATAEAVFGTVPPDLLSSAGRLTWLQVHQAAPPAGYYYPELVAHPVVVTNMRGIFDDRIPAHIMAFVLAFARGIHIYVRRQLERKWSREDPVPVVHLSEATVLIIGVGSVGAETARLCAAHGMRVVGVDPRRTDRPEGVSEMYPSDALELVLSDADFVVLTVPHTPKTEGFFDAARFAQMKPSAFFINIGRGMTTRLADLDRALREGTIAGAALDVFEIEPLPSDHPLWTAPNTLLTPHVAAVGPSLEPRKMAVVAENARRFARGEPLLNLVDKANWF